VRLDFKGKSRENEPNFQSPGRKEKEEGRVLTNFDETELRVIPAQKATNCDNAAGSPLNLPWVWQSPSAPFRGSFQSIRPPSLVDGESFPIPPARSIPSKRSFVELN
jgi:hypothetical protein